MLLKLHFTPERMSFEAVGIRILREAGRIGLGALPDIFTHVPAREYALLVPLNARAFLAENCRTVSYLEPERFAGADASAWEGYYRTERPDLDWDGYSRGAHVDFDLLLPLAQKADEGNWEASTLETVKSYLWPSSEEKTDREEPVSFLRI